MEWLVTLVDKLFIWVPRIELIRSTHRGVKWRASLFGGEPEIIELKPGLHWFWPLTSELVQVVTARQPTDIAPMSLLTSDGESVVLSASVIFRINNVVLAIGERNWDVDAAVVDITQGVIFNAVRGSEFSCLVAGHDDLVRLLTEGAKKELSKFGVLVERVLLKDFDRSKTYRLLGETTNLLNIDPDQD